MIFGTLKDDSLSIKKKGLALNNNYSYRNVFQNDVNSLSEMIIENLFFFFLSKSSKFRVF